MDSFHKLLNINKINKDFCHVFHIFVAWLNYEFYLTTPPPTSAVSPHSAPTRPVKLRISPYSVPTRFVKLRISPHSVPTSDIFTPP